MTCTLSKWCVKNRFLQVWIHNKPWFWNCTDLLACIPSLTTWAYRVMVELQLCHFLLFLELFKQNPSKITFFGQIFRFNVSLTEPALYFEKEANNLSGAFYCESLTQETQQRVSWGFFFFFFNFTHTSATQTSPFPSSLCLTPAPLFFILFGVFFAPSRRSCILFLELLNAFPLKEELSGKKKKQQKRDFWFDLLGFQRFFTD